MHPAAPDASWPARADQPERGHGAVVVECAAPPRPARRSAACMTRQTLPAAAARRSHKHARNAHVARRRGGGSALLRCPWGLAAPWGTDRTVRLARDTAARGCRAPTAPRRAAEARSRRTPRVGPRRPPRPAPVRRNRRRHRRCCGARRRRRRVLGVCPGRATGRRRNPRAGCRRGGRGRGHRRGPRRRARRDRRRARPPVALLVLVPAASVAILLAVRERLARERDMLRASALSETRSPGWPTVARCWLASTTRSRAMAAAGAAFRAADARPGRAQAAERPLRPSGRR